jgi:hypothetical protein
MTALARQFAAPIAITAAQGVRLIQIILEAGT